MVSHSIPGRPTIRRHSIPRIPCLSTEYILNLYDEVEDSLDRVWGEKHEKKTYRFLGIYQCPTEPIRKFDPRNGWDRGMNPDDTWWYPTRWPVNPNFFAKCLIWLFLYVWLGLILRPMFIYKSLCYWINEFAIHFHTAICTFFSPNTDKKWVKMNILSIFTKIPDSVQTALKYAIIAGACVLVVNHFYDGYKKDKEAKYQGTVATLERANKDLISELEKRDKAIGSENQLVIDTLESRAQGAITAADMRQRRDELLKALQEKWDAQIAAQEEIEKEEQRQAEIQKRLDAEQERLKYAEEVRQAQQKNQGNIYSLADGYKKPSVSSISLKATELPSVTKKAPTAQKQAPKATTKTTTTKSKTPAVKTTEQLKKQKEIEVSQVHIDYLWQVYNQAVTG